MLYTSGGLSTIVFFCGRFYNVSIFSPTQDSNCGGLKLIINTMPLCFSERAITINYQNYLN